MLVHFHMAQFSPFFFVAILNENQSFLFCQNIAQIKAYSFLNAHPLITPSSNTPYYPGNGDQQQAKLCDDTQLVEFYDEFLRNTGLDIKYRLKAFNLVNVLAQFIIEVSFLNNHYSGSVSFEYLIDPTYTGLKIINNEKCNDCNTKQTFMEYCLVSLSKGWNLLSFDGRNISSTIHNAKKNDNEGYWKKVLLKDEHLEKNMLLFEQYFDKTKGSDFHSRLQRRKIVMIINK